MPMDAYRAGDEFVVAFDLPGVSPDPIELDVERNVLTVTAERRPTAAGDNDEMQVAERPRGVFSRQLSLGDALDTEHDPANYDPGVLTLRIPVAEQAKPQAPAGESNTNTMPARRDRRGHIDDVDDPNARRARCSWSPASPSSSTSPA